MFRELLDHAKEELSRRHAALKKIVIAHTQVFYLGILTFSKSNAFTASQLCNKPAIIIAQKDTYETALKNPSKTPKTFGAWGPPLLLKTHTMTYPL